MEIILTVVAFLLGGIVRSLVGAGYVSRWAGYIPCGIVCAAIGLADLPVDLMSMADILWAVLISCHLGLGYTQWEDRKWMVLRFGIPAVMLAGPLLFFGEIEAFGAGLYILLSLAAGALYPDRQKIYEMLKLDRIQSSFIDSARLAEFVAGACMLGGLSVL